MRALTGRVTETAGAYDDAEGVEDWNSVNGWDDASGAFVDEDAAWGFLKKAFKAVKKAGSGVVKSALAPARIVAGAATQIAKGQRLDKVLSGAGKAVLSDFRAKARIASMAASFVPGMGTGVAAALGAAGALAEGRPISEAVIAGARSAIPGGPLGRAAFDAGLSLAKGQSLTAAALNAARNNLPGGKAAQAAFDAAVALAQGKKLQEAAFAAAGRVLPASPASASALEFARAVASGRPVAEAALSTAGKVAMQQIQGAAMKQVNQFAPGALGKLAAARSFVNARGFDPNDSGDPLDNAGDPLAAVLRPRVRVPALQTMHLPPGIARATSAILNRPELRRLNPAQLAQALSISGEEARQALASVARSIATRSPAMTLSPRAAMTIGRADTLDSLMGKIGRPAAARFTAKSRGRWTANAGAVDMASPWYGRGITQGQADARGKLPADPQRRLSQAGATVAGHALTGNDRDSFLQGYTDGYLRGLAERGIVASDIAAWVVKPAGSGKVADPIVKQAQADLVTFEKGIGTQEPAGWGPSDVDGIAGPRTATAASLFQRLWNKRTTGPAAIKKLRTDGTLDADTVAALAFEVRKVPLPASFAPPAPVTPPALPPPPPPPAGPIVVVSTPPAPATPPPSVPQPPAATTPALPPAPGPQGGNNAPPPAAPAPPWVPLTPTPPEMLPKEPAKPSSDGLGVLALLAAAAAFA